MNYSVLGDPARAAHFPDWFQARSAGNDHVQRHHPSIGIDFRVEQADSGSGWVVRIYKREGRPVEDRIGWLTEKRITAPLKSRRKSHAETD